MIHGGGFIVGSIETEHIGAVLTAADLGAVLISVDYRLAPEHRYPAALHDCYAALTYIHAEADALGVDTSRVALMGASAGGGLAAATALLARDQGGPALCFQMLHIPELDDRLQTRSMESFVDTPVWNRPLAEQSWRAYLGDIAGSSDVPMYAAPARATDLHGLPPAYVSTAENDPLRDEGITYALGLLHAGVSVELHQFPGTFHGSALVMSAAVSRRAQQESAAVLRRALGVAEAAGPAAALSHPRSVQALRDQHADSRCDRQRRVGQPEQAGPLEVGVLPGAVRPAEPEDPGQRAADEEIRAHVQPDEERVGVRWLAAARRDAAGRLLTSTLVTAAAAAVPQAFRCASIIAGPSHARPSVPSATASPRSPTSTGRPRNSRAWRAVAGSDAERAVPALDRPEQDGPDAHRCDGHGRRAQRDHEHRDRGDGEQAEADRRALGFADRCDRRAQRTVMPCADDERGHRRGRQGGKAMWRNKAPPERCRCPSTMRLVRLDPGS